MHDHIAQPNQFQIFTKLDTSGPFRAPSTNLFQHCGCMHTMHAHKHVMCMLLTTECIIIYLSQIKSYFLLNWNLRSFKGSKHMCISALWLHAHNACTQTCNVYATDYRVHNHISQPKQVLFSPSLVLKDILGYQSQIHNNIFIACTQCMHRNIQCACYLLKSA